LVVVARTRKKGDQVGEGNCLLNTNSKSASWGVRKKATPLIREGCEEKGKIILSLIITIFLVAGERTH